jgi:hypothetical protein
MAGIDDRGHFWCDADLDRRPTPRMDRRKAGFTEPPGGYTVAADQLTPARLARVSPTFAPVASGGAEVDRNPPTRK